MVRFSSSMFPVDSVSAAHLPLVGGGHLGEAGVQLAGEHHAVPLDHVAPAQELADILPFTWTRVTLLHVSHWYTCDPPSLMTG